MANRTRRDSRTVNKYADMEEFNVKPKRGDKQIVSPVIGLVGVYYRWVEKGGFEEEIEFRSIAKRIWELLQ